MSDLRRMQRLFQGAVAGLDTEFLSHIEQGGKISRERRLHIYQHAYRARLRDVLEEDFPVLHSMLGDEGFEELCLRYIDAYPSSHPSLRYFGQHMAEFTTSERPYMDQKIIGEMARFEWIFHDVFDAPNQDPVTVEDVAALSPEVWTTLRFDFHPSLSVAAFDWNVAAVWSSVQEEDDEITMPEQMPEITYVIQWRRDLTSYFRTLDRDEAAVLLLAKEKKSFPDICENLMHDHGDKAPVRAAELLKNWVVEGLIISLDHMNISVYGHSQSR